MDLSEEPRFLAPALPPTRLEILARHPLGIAVRVLAAGGAIFLGGVTLVLAAFNYSFKRPTDAVWTDRFVESAAVAGLGLTVAIVVLLTAWRPTPRRLLATLVVLTAVPLVGRAL